MNHAPLQNVQHLLDYIETHFLDAAKSEGVAASCTATCLLLFAAADALGCAYLPDMGIDDGRSKNRKRFEWTFKELGSRYENRLSEVWELRNSLVHEALNASAYLSQVHDWMHDHLELTQQGKLLLNTREMTNDFDVLLRRLKQDVENHTSSAIAANGRLVMVEDAIDVITQTTSPGPYRFQHLKRR